MEIKEWWPRLSFEAKQHLKDRVREPLDMSSQDALQAAGVLPPDARLALSLSDDEWTWVEQHG